MNELHAALLTYTAALARLAELEESPGDTDAAVAAALDLRDDAESAVTNAQATTLLQIAAKLDVAIDVARGECLVGLRHEPRLIELLCSARRDLRSL